MANPKSKFKKGTEIRWTSKGPAGQKKRKGIVRGFCLAGEELKFPKSADLAKFKAEPMNQIHNRYLVEIVRVHKRTGKKLKSQWLAPKAVTLEKTAKLIA
jgi:hypothetical protein